MSIRALNWKPFERGSMRGFFDLAYFGLVIKSCRLMDGKNGLWVALPQEKREKDGDTKYHDLLFLTPPEREHVRKMVVDDLTAQGHIQAEQERKAGAPKQPKQQRSYERYGVQEDLSMHFPDNDQHPDIPF